MKTNEQTVLSEDDLFEIHLSLRSRADYACEEDVIDLDRLADYIADTWPMDKEYSLEEICQRLHAMWPGEFLPAVSLEKNLPNIREALRALLIWWGRFQSSNGNQQNAYNLLVKGARTAWQFASVEIERADIHHTAPAAQDSKDAPAQQCVACEGKPSGDNVPCAVCGKDAPAQQQDPTDPGYDVATLREHVRHLERRVRQLSAPAAQGDERAWTLPALLAHILDNAECAGHLDIVPDLRNAVALSRQPSAAGDPTDPGHDVEVLREHVRHLERRVRQLSQPSAAASVGHIPHQEYTKGWQDCLSVHLAPYYAAFPSDEQGAFEAWAAPRHFEVGHKDSKGEYIGEATVIAWSAWQGRAALAAAKPEGGSHE
jgi:hypothetical protein